MASAASQEPHVRYATQADVPEILAMIHELAIYEKEPEAVKATEETLLKTLSFPPFPSQGYAKTLLVFPPTAAGASSAPDDSAASTTGTTGAKPAGMALFFHNYSTWEAAPGVYLEDLFVRPEFRGRGYASRLLAELARVTKDVGGRRLEWSVLKWNEPSIRFYQGKSVNATRMEDWVGMRVDGDALDKLAAGGSSLKAALSS